MTIQDRREWLDELEADRRKRNENADTHTAEDREAARVEAMLEAELTPAELKAAHEEEQTATEYARANLGVSGVIEATKQDGWASHEFKNNQIKAALPDKTNRRGNPVAQRALSYEETAAAKRAKISAEQLIQREYGIDASLHDEISLQEAMSEVRHEKRSTRGDRR